MAPPWVGGVASGLAERFSVPVSAVRAGFVGLSPVFGLGFMLYMWLWLSVPAEGMQEDPRAGFRSPLAAKLTPTARLGLQGRPNGQSQREGARNANRLPVADERQRRILAGQLALGGVGFLAVAAVFAVSTALLHVSWATVFGFLLIAGGILLSWVQAPKFARGRNREASAYVAASVAVAMGGLVLLMDSLGMVPKLTTGIAIAGLVLVVLAVALVPLVMKVMDDLADSREREIREAERADIAAHLHDSVLQTLTLIRANAEDPTAARSLALRQERELRTWLYTGQPVAETSVAQALKTQVETLEGTYGVEVDVVTVGDRQPAEAELAGLAAATEAVANAIKHGLPPITVYQETQDRAVDIYVKDSGHGFDPSQIPPDRHGYQGSIVDRVERVGGTVTVRQPNKADQSAGNPGTEIHIHIPVDGRRGAASSTEADKDSR